jgi:hypothetical protein
MQVDEHLGAIRRPPQFGDCRMRNPVDAVWVEQPETSILPSPRVGLGEDLSQLVGKGAGNDEHVDPVWSQRSCSERLGPILQAIAVSLVDVDEADMNLDSGVTALDLASLVTGREGSPIALTIWMITAGVDSRARESID